MERNVTALEALGVCREYGGVAADVRSSTQDTLLTISRCDMLGQYLWFDNEGRRTPPCSAVVSAVTIDRTRPCNDGLYVICMTPRAATNSGSSSDESFTEGCVWE